jgi:hypothetical protein
MIREEAPARPSSRGGLTGLLVLLVSLGAGAGTLAAQGPAGALDAAFTSFWRAADPAAAAIEIPPILAASRDFAMLHARLRAGRPYRAGLVGDFAFPPLRFTPAGILSKARMNTRGLWHPYVIAVPPTYDATRPYPVRFYLHGDTTQPASSAESGVRWLNYEALAREDAIVVFPGAWNGFPWWSTSQIEHMAGVLDELKRLYNVDENRVFMLGSSDGGTGAYYHAMLATTPWAAFLPFNADPSVLTYPQAGVDAQLYPSNLTNKPLFVVHGGLDQIYPVSALEPWLRLFTTLGTSVTLRVKEGYGHETRWWTEEMPVMDAFMASHARIPLPDRLSWETAYTDGTNRAHWLVIDELGRAAGERLPETDEMVAPAAPGLGVGTWREVEKAGVQLMAIQPGSPMDAQGFRGGDIIESVDGRTTARVTELLQVASGVPGRTLQVQLLRGGQRLTQPLVVPGQPDAAPVVTFARQRSSGRVDLQRRGNTVDVRTRGVRRFTLLLSPDQFDFAQPVTVVVNGVQKTHHPVARAEVLLKWAARDNDRTMLFGDELTIALPAPEAQP